MRAANERTIWARRTIFLIEGEAGEHKKMQTRRGKGGGGGLQGIVLCPRVKEVAICKNFHIFPGHLELERKKTTHRLIFTFK